MKRVVTVLALLGAVAAGVAAQTKYGVVVKADPKVDFSAIKSYCWTSGWPSPDKDIDRKIVAAIDHELAGLGLTKVQTGCDAVVRYGSQRRTDVNLEGKKDTDGLRPSYAVGTLLILMNRPSTGKAEGQELFRARTDTPIDPSQRDKVEATINEQVAAVFAKYPTRQAAK